MKKKSVQAEIVQHHDAGMPHAHLPDAAVKVRLVFPGGKWKRLPH